MTGPPCSPVLTSCARSGPPARPHPWALTLRFWGSLGLRVLLCGACRRQQRSPLPAPQGRAPPGVLRHGSGWTVGGPAGSGPPLSCCEVTPSSAVLPFILTPQVTESGSQLPTGIICSVMSFCLCPQSLSPVKTLMCPTARALWRLRGGCGLSWKPQQQVGLCAPNTARVWSDYPAAKTGSGAHSFTLWSL